MKISKLHINQFRHLENLDFDFTYPEDFHIAEKRGKPLDKICFIGQSATGKTSLLDLIFNDIQTIKSIELDEDGNFWRKEGSLFSNIKIEIENKLIETKIDFTKKDFQFGYLEIFINNKKLELTKRNVTSVEKLFKINPFGIYDSNAIGEILLFLKANIVSEKNINFLNTNPIELKESIYKQSNIELTNILLFDDEINIKLWYKLLFNIIEFHGKRYQKYNELIGKGLISDLKKFNYQVQDFLKNNPNPLENLAKKFNSIYNKFGLQIDDKNTEYSIPFNNIKKDEIIPIHDTSTGTKQLLLTSLPLYQINTKDSIILIDEPERSLYPDIQMDLMEHYQNLTQDAQFIVATHSPFIAASFEPEERFILYFDEEGKVAVRRGSSPIGDDPNDILYNDFGIDYINKYGKKVYNDYLEKRRQLLFEEDEEVKNKLQNEIESIGDKYNF